MAKIKKLRLSQQNSTNQYLTLWVLLSSFMYSLYYLTTTKNLCVCVRLLLSANNLAPEDDLIYINFYGDIVSASNHLAMGFYVYANKN